MVAATSEPGHVVTNGMSQYSRAERNANAGIVVGISPEDYAQPGHRDDQHGRAVHPLDGIAFQRRWETRAFELGGGDYYAPGQLLGDFLRRQRSTEFGSVLPSYTPGVRLTDLAQPGHGSLPDDVLEAIRDAMPAFDRQIKGFAMPDAVFTGVETRTSSPLRITRGRDLQSVNVQGLLSGRRGRRVRGRHHVGRCRRHRNCRGRCASDAAHLPRRCFCREFRLKARLDRETWLSDRDVADEGVTREIAAFRCVPLTGRAARNASAARLPVSAASGKVTRRMSVRRFQAAGVDS